MLHLRGNSCQQKVVIFVILLTLNLVKAQERIDMNCDPAFSHRYEVCPAGYCCVRDEFLPTYVYCRKIGQLDENCTTKDNESECPCDTGLYCKANILGQFPSVYGHCTVNPNMTTTDSTPTTENTVTTDTTENTVTTDTTENTVTTDTSPTPKDTPQTSPTPEVTTETASTPMSSSQNNSTADLPSGLPSSFPQPVIIG